MLLSVFVAALLGMRLYLTRAVQERYRQAGDIYGQGEQYAPHMQTQVSTFDGLPLTFPPPEVDPTVSMCAGVQAYLDELQGQIDILNPRIAALNGIAGDVAGHDGEGYDVMGALNTAQQDAQEDSDMTGQLVQHLQRDFDTVRADRDFLNDFLDQGGGMFPTTGRLTRWQNELATIDDPETIFNEARIATDGVIADMLLAQTEITQRIEAENAMDAILQDDIEDLDALIGEIETRAGDKETRADALMAQAQASSDPDEARRLTSQADSLYQEARWIREYERAMFRDDREDVEDFSEELQTSSQDLGGSNGEGGAWGDIDDWIDRLTTSLASRWAVRNEIDSMKQLFAGMVDTDEETLDDLDIKLYPQLSLGDDFGMTIAELISRYLGGGDIGNVEDLPLTSRQQMYGEVLTSYDNQIQELSNLIGGSPTSYDLTVPIGDLSGILTEMSRQLGELQQTMQDYQDNPAFSACFE